jgi:hypothetical protein
MSIECKKRNVEHMLLFEPLTNFLHYDQIQVVKKRKINSKIKRKSSNHLFNVTKKQKVNDNWRCLIHKEEYICDIYDCSGVKHIKECNKSCYTSYIN